MEIQMTLSDLQDLLPTARLFKCCFSYSCAAVYKISCCMVPLVMAWVLVRFAATYGVFVCCSAGSYVSAQYFTRQFGGVHAFGYNSAISEPICMKSQAL